MNVIKMDFRGRFAGIFRRDEVNNCRVQEIRKSSHTLTGDVKTIQLVYYGHVQRMSEDLLPLKAGRKELALKWWGGGGRVGGKELTGQ